LNISCHKKKESEFKFGGINIIKKIKIKIKIKYKYKYIYENFNVSENNICSVETVKVLIPLIPSPLSKVCI